MELPLFISDRGIEVRLTVLSTVIGSLRVYKALRDQMAITLAELKRIEAGQAVDDELLDAIRMMTVILGGMKKEEV